ncbi:hypothetical protein [Streptosporangium sp. NPDC002721]|uniref:hypothetical protein n=1 Tax=Streptosporangium sp. NPDC002721 TaxID=3366188 RepID=UPI0036CD96A3
MAAVSAAPPRQTGRTGRARWAGWPLTAWRSGRAPLPLRPGRHVHRRHTSQLGHLVAEDLPVGLRPLQVLAQGRELH